MASNEISQEFLLLCSLHTSMHVGLIWAFLMHEIGRAVIETFEADE